MEPKVSIILVNYESYQDTIDCINSLYKLTYKNMNIIVVDNCSADNSVEMIQAKCKNIILLKSLENKGWSSGNNIGIKYAVNHEADYILLLNTDTIVKENFLTEIINCGKNNEDAGLIGCKIMYFNKPNTIWFAGGMIDWYKILANNIGNKEVDNGQYDIEKEIDYVTGCALLIKKEVVNVVGLLPEEYFMYFEDVDYSVKVKEAGYKIIYYPNGIVYHKVSSSTGGEDSPFTIKWITRNRFLFLKKFRNKALKGYIPAYIHILLSQLKNIIKYICKLDFKRCYAIFQGIILGVESNNFHFYNFRL